MGLNIPQLPELTFEEDSHTYRLDGLIIPKIGRASCRERV